MHADRMTQKSKNLQTGTSIIKACKPVFKCELGVSSALGADEVEHPPAVASSTSGAYMYVSDTRYFATAFA
jgi:hypothetical protein